jgi:hypothetical protein
MSLTDGLKALRTPRADPVRRTCQPGTSRYNDTRNAMCRASSGLNLLFSGG